MLQGKEKVWDASSYFLRFWQRLQWHVERAKKPVYAYHWRVWSRKNCQHQACHSGTFQKHLQVIIKLIFLLATHMTSSVISQGKNLFGRASIFDYTSLLSIAKRVTTVNSVAGFVRAKSDTIEGELNFRKFARKNIFLSVFFSNGRQSCGFKLHI